MARSSIVIDTSLLIDHERGVEHASVYVARLLSANTGILHPVTVAEVLFGATNRLHLQALRAMLRPFRVLAIKNVDFTHANQLLDQNVLAQRVGWPDCFIAASCIRLGFPLATLNDRHFRWIPRMKVIRPY